jgi:hypothetical protein
MQSFCEKSENQKFLVKKALMKAFALPPQQALGAIVLHDYKAKYALTQSWKALYRTLNPKP